MSGVADFFLGDILLVTEDEDSVTEKEDPLNNCDDKHECPNCKRSYRHRYSMLKHLREECGKPPAFACNECDYRTKLKGNLKKHTDLKHKKKATKRKSKSTEE